MSFLVNRLVNANNITQFGNFSVEWIEFNLFTCGSPATIDVSLFSCVTPSYTLVEDVSCLTQIWTDFQSNTCQSFATTQVHVLNLTETMI